MRRRNIYIVLFILISIIVLGIGYAAIGNINLIANGSLSAIADQSNFDVKFLSTGVNAPTIQGSPTNSVTVTSNTTASFNVLSLVEKDDSVTAILKVKNESNNVGARISLNLSNSNSEYFKVTEHVDDTELQVGDITTVTVTVKMIKTAFENNQATNITATLIVSPIDDSTAVGNSSAQKVVPGPVSFATDSWETIQSAVQDDDTSVYNIGDTKEVTINGVDYTVRLANKTTGEHCGDNDTAYSQTACGFVVEFVDIITKVKMQNTYTNVGGYPATLVYDYLDNTLFGQLPLDLQTAIKPTRVISGHGDNGTDSANFTTTDNLYLLSPEEVYGTDLGGMNHYDAAYGTSHQLEYYSNNSVTWNTTIYNGTNYDKAIKQYNSSNYWWWLRAAYSNYSYYFRYVDNGGNLSGNDASDTNGVAPAFRIG